MFSEFDVDGPDIDEINRHVREDPNLIMAVAASPLSDALLHAMDHKAVRDLGKALGVPLNVLLAIKSELIAIMTISLAPDRVSLQAARAYAIYRVHADELQAHARQVEVLDPRALAAVVEAKIYARAEEAGAAIWDVIETCEPILEQMAPEEDKQ